MESAERHFRLMIWLMLLFLLVDISSDAVYLTGYTSAKIGNGLSRDAFMATWGVALGIFRNMKPGV